MSSRVLKMAKYALRFVPDIPYIQMYYFARFRRLCNLRNPVTYNEKLNWLKLHDRRAEYVRMVDKYEAKEYVAGLIGREYIIPTLGVWERFDDIDFNALPDQFVLKCTHDSEGVVIVRDKSRMDIEAARDKIEAAMKCNFYYIGREWPYRNIKPRIIAEQYMEDHVDGELRDYKFFCFNGEPKAMFIASERGPGTTKFDYYDLDFHHLDLIQHYPNAAKPPRKPDTFEQMIELARTLTRGIPHVRADFYEVDGRLYFGELTFFHFSGFMPFQPAKWDKIFGKWLELPVKK